MLEIFTSGHCECGKFVFSHGKTGTVVSCNSHHIPSSCIQIEHNEIAARFDIVRNLMPFDAVPVNVKENEGFYLNAFLLWFLLQS